MEFGTGAMSSLLPKLGELLLKECNLKPSVKNGIEELKAELESIQAALAKVSRVPLDQLDTQVKIWANEARELSYAIEDILDSFVTRVGGAEPTKPKFQDLLEMARGKCADFKARHEIANDIKDIETQVRKINERYDRYKIDCVDGNVGATSVDPRLSAQYNKVSDLVGMEEAIDELTKVLSKGVDTSEEYFKIVSIVGFGGLGKTTFAKALYDKFNQTYHFQCFIPVGRNPDTKKVLRHILLELSGMEYRATAMMDHRELINQLQKYLARRRYFIVIDDIWDIQTWETIKCAFVDSHSEGRIIITTRIADVARIAGGIYHMKPLSDDNSRLLFQTRTFGYERVYLSPDIQPSEVTTNFLKKCGGVPLAIITIATLLVGKPSVDWCKVYDAIGFDHEDSEVIQNTRKMLSFSYYDLRPHLKNCLLYLGMYPEDNFIQKKPLIWRWVCEGFVPDKQGTGSYEVGESYYNELVNKNMILEESCRVHDMVLDLVRTISMEVNFATIQDPRENHITPSPNEGRNRVHRLALHGAKVEHHTSIKMRHVRSFNATSCSDSRTPPLSIFKVLRVLVIDECDFLEGQSLEHLGKLVHLRYLGLVNTSVKLPEGLGHDLKFLEILDVRGGFIRELPPSLGDLKNLRCLWADAGTTMKGEIGKLTCLEELQLHEVDMCPNFFTDVGNLTKLRVLKITCYEIEESASEDLVEYLCNLPTIHCLEVWCNYEYHPPVLGGSLEDLAPSSKLHSLCLEKIIIPRMPSWISSFCLPLLSEVRLHVEVVKSRDFQALGRLPSLVILFLEGEHKSMSYTFGSNEFPMLKWLVVKIEVTIGEGALPMLEVLGYSASARRKEDVTSLVPWNNRFPFLSYVTCWLDCANVGNEEVKAVEAVLSDAAQTHPECHELNIERENYDRKAGKFIDELELILILGGLDRPDEVDRTTDEEKIRGMVTSLETLLCDDVEPRVGRYGEQELRGFVAKFKSWLPDHADANQEEVDGILKPAKILLSPLGRPIN